MYGQYIHLVHHLYPKAPRYRLPDLHRELLRKSPEYAADVVECNGTFRAREGCASIVDVVSR